MKIVVCVKQIQNPEIPSAQFRIDEQAKVLIPVSGLQPVLSPFDEQAVEAALRIRDSAGEDADVEITIVTIASKASRAPIKAALALGADNAVLLSDSMFDGSGGYVTARNLAEAVRTIGDVDLIVCVDRQIAKSFATHGLNIDRLPVIRHGLDDGPVTPHPCDKNLVILIHRKVNERFTAMEGDIVRSTMREKQQ